MEVVQTFFGQALLLDLAGYDDLRGPMRYLFREKDYQELGVPFTIKDLRSYVMKNTGTFFGIHYQGDDNPMGRIITVIQGSGEDYIVDLRPDSPTYLKWVQNTLTAESKKAVYVPHGFGHAFISTEDNTIQIYAASAYGGAGISKQLNYREKKIGLVLPGPVTAIAEYDDKAPYLDDLK